MSKIKVFSYRSLLFLKIYQIDNNSRLPSKYKFEFLSDRFRIFANMIRNISIFVSFLLLLTACEREVIIDVAPISGKLVIVSNFSSGNALERDSFMRVTVSRTAPALTQIDTLINVPDAVVELFLNNEDFKERLQYQLPTPEEKLRGIQPYYTTRSFIPVAGEIYTLKVSAPNFTPVEATGFIPSTDAQSDAFITTSESVTTNGFVNVDYTLDLTIHDFPTVENFYHVNLYQFINLLRVSAAGDTARTEIVIGPLPFNLKDNNQEVLPYIDNRGVLIKDDNFDGGSGNFVFEGNFLYNPNSEEVGDFVVELRNTSRDYYLYHSSLARQVRVQSGFDAISGPVVLHNNIENGCGIFAGYSPVFTRLDLPN